MGQFRGSEGETHVDVRCHIPEVQLDVHLWLGLQGDSGNRRDRIVTGLLQFWSTLHR